MIDNILFALWFFLPAGVANASPVFASRIPLLRHWKTPIDFGKTWNSKPIFGKNKTWRGLLFGAFCGGITGSITYLLYPDSINYLSLTTFTPIIDMFIVGAALGSGALVGDAVESFFKRRVGVKPGESWFPFDQIDFIIGGLVFVTPFVTLSFKTSVLILLVWFFGHLFWSYVGYLLKLKDKPI